MSKHSFGAKDPTLVFKFNATWVISQDAYPRLKVLGWLVLEQPVAIRLRQHRESSYVDSGS